MLYIPSPLKKRKIFFTGKPGNDPNGFIDYLKECYCFMSISDPEIYNSSPVILHCEALNWFRLNIANFSTRNELYKVFIHQYRVRNFQDRLMHKSYAGQQAKNEPITLFVTNLRVISDQINPQLSLNRNLDIACNNLNPNPLHTPWSNNVFLSSR